MLDGYTSRKRIPTSVPPLRKWNLKEAVNERCEDAVCEEAGFLLQQDAAIQMLRGNSSLRKAPEKPHRAQHSVLTQVRFCLGSSSWAHESPLPGPSSPVQCICYSMSSALLAEGGRHSRHTPCTVAYFCSWKRWGKSRISKIMHPSSSSLLCQTVYYFVFTVRLPRVPTPPWCGNIKPDSHIIWSISRLQQRSWSPLTQVSSRPRTRVQLGLSIELATMSPHQLTASSWGRQLLCSSVDMVSDLQ